MLPTRTFPVLSRPIYDSRGLVIHHSKEPDITALWDRCHATSWQKAVADPACTLCDGTWDDFDAYGVCLAPNLVAFDFDTDKTGGENGWERFQKDIGAAYGSRDFPRTALVRTPSGGVHGIYAIPHGIRLKNSVHGHLPGERDTYPLDLRVGGKGYTVGAGSIIEMKEPNGSYKGRMGRYVAVDLPPDGRIPEITPAMGGLITALNYVNGVNPTSSPPDLFPGGDPIYRPDFNGAEHPWVVHATWAPRTSHNTLLSQSTAICHAYRENNHSQQWLDDALQRLINAVPARHWASDGWEIRPIINSALDAVEAHATVTYPAGY